MYATGSNIYTGDKAGDNLALSLTNVTDDDYFVLNSKDAATAGNDDAVTTVLQYLSSKNSGDSTQTIKFKNLNTGDTFERTFEDDCTFDISVGGKTHNFVNASSHVCTSDNWPIAISGTDFTYDNTKSGNETVHTLSMRDASGALIQVADQGWGTDANGNDTDNDWTQGLGTTEGLTVTIKVDDSDRGDDVVSLTSARTETQYNVTYTATDEVRASRLSFSGWTSSDPDDTDVTWGYTDYGSKLYHVAPSSTPQEFTLTVPETARKMALYVTSGATTTSTSASGDLAPVTVVDATKLDSEIASVDAQNLIVVGGPCVNSVSAELLGSPSDCTEGFTPGRARVKLFEHANGNMAMLVAGFSGQDTRLAGRVMAHRSGELTGMEVEIEGTTFSDATIGAPAPVVMVEETVEEVVVDDSTGTE
ncbi:hypothetical protein HOC32_03065 [Candidatus Woesearchaeota archaeon]|nr:hypothetical protein [Candidatus Woesearchaeota archaeon]